LNQTPDARSSQLGLLIRALVALLAAAIIITAYYVTHKPLDPPVALRLGGALLDLGTVAALFVTAGGIGWAALAWLDRRLALNIAALSRPERLALAGTLGLALVSTAALGLGLVGLYRGLVMWGLLLVAAVVVRRSVGAWLREWAAALHSIRFETPWVAFLIVFAFGLLGLALVYALAAPQTWDALAYQLVGPKRYLQTGIIAPQPDNFYLGFPGQVNMLFGLTMGLFGRETAAAPVHFLYGLYGLLACAGLVRRFADRAAGWMAVVLLLSAYNLWALFGWAYNDLATMTYGALALVAAVGWKSSLTEREGRNGWLILLGALVGLAVGVKYTAGGLALAVGVFVALHQPRAVLRNGLIVGGAAFVAFLPWALRGLLLYGNPIYPFVFDGLNWDALRSEFFSFSERGLAATGQAWQAALLPISATVFGMDKTDGFGFTAGPWLMTAFLLLPLVWAWLGAQARRLARWTLIFLAPMLLMWAYTALGSSVGMQTRLMTMTLPAFAVAGALAFHGLAGFPQKPLDLRFMVRALLVITLMLGLLEIARTMVRERVVPHVLGMAEKGDYLYATTGAYYGAVQNLATLPAGSQVRLMWEPRAYYCPDSVSCTADVLFDHWLRPVLQGASPDEAFEGYRAAGDDYLLLWHAGFEEYREVFARYEAQIAEFMPALERHMTPIWTDGLRYTLYAWR
jgi:hypothetical protein